MGREGTKPSLQVSESVGQSSACSQPRPAGGPQARLPPTWPARPPRPRPRPAPGSRPRSHRCGPVLQPGRAEPAGRRGKSSRNIASRDPPFTHRAPTRVGPLWPLWCALGRQCHRLLLPASVPAGDPQLRSPDSYWEKVPGATSGREAPPVWGAPCRWTFPSQCLWPLGKDPGTTTVSQDPNAGDRVF